MLKPFDNTSTTQLTEQPYPLTTLLRNKAGDKINKLDQLQSFELCHQSCVIDAQTIRPADDLPPAAT